MTNDLKRLHRYKYISVKEFLKKIIVKVTIMHQVKIELDDNEYEKLLKIASILKEKGYVGSEDEVPTVAKILLKVAIRKFVRKFAKEGLITSELTEGSIKRKEIYSPIKSETARPSEYPSYNDWVICKATETGRRIFFSPFDDEYKEYLKEFRKKNLRNFD